MRAPFLRLVLASIVVLAVTGCKTIPPDRYGIRRLHIEGAEAMDEEAIRACLATSERSRLGFDLGTSSDLTCGEPPFDGSRARVRLFSWPWTEWPTLDGSIFERDLERIERWYRARGFYDARVLAAEFDPPSAAVNDELPERDTDATRAPCERRDEDEGCSVDVTITVEEGEPVLLTALTIGSTPNVSARTRRSIERAPTLEVGDRFDEALYDESKERMVSRLREEGYACASVTGRVTVDPDAHTAVVALDVSTGPIGHFASVDVVVSGDAEDIPLDTVRGAAGIDVGDRFSSSRITAAQRAVYGLGAFASVEVDARPRQIPGADGAPATCSDEVDVVITVTPGRKLRYGVGFGVQIGESLNSTANTPNPRQWDIHVQAFVEHRNFFGGLRRFRIEERPKLVFPDQFPGVRAGQNTPETSDDALPTFGNELRLTFRQPAFIESRTTLEIGGRWDYGPDPIYPANIRHDIEASIILSRPFWNGRVLGAIGVHSQSYVQSCSLFDTGCDPLAVDNVQPGYHLSFFSQSLRLDLRDDARSTRRGVYLALDLQEALPTAVSTFTYVRIVPEARFFVPLPFRTVLAMRFSIGVMHGIAFGGDPRESDQIKSCALGPTRFRLRGGGPNSHRGFSAAALGDVDDGASDDQGFDPAIPGSCRIDGTPDDPAFYEEANPFFEPIDGGIRRWEASLELRTRITESFGVVGFIDMGDVNREPRFRFRNVNTALGFGLRYYTIVGPVRLDFSFFPNGAQYIGDDSNNLVRRPSYVGGRVNGTFTLTIGEAF